jgi:hypothetical protein
MTEPLRLELDRSAKTPLAEQIRKGIRAAIESGVLAPGARLPSWQERLCWALPKPVQKKLALELVFVG